MYGGNQVFENCVQPVLIHSLRLSGEAKEIEDRW
jgi:hypothetical protein